MVARGSSARTSTTGSASSTLELPPLRERGDDMLRARRSTSRSARRARRASRWSAARRRRRGAAARYGWPGNVRELQNCIERAVVLCQFDRIRVDNLPERMRGYERRPALAAAPAPAPPAPPAPEAAPVSLDRLEQQHIERVLAMAGGNKSAAARVLGLSRRTLHRKSPAGR